MNADSVLNYGFTQVLEWMKWTVVQLKSIPTGLGVSLWTVLIVTLITTIVSVAIVNVVSVGGDSYINYTHRQRDEARYQRRASENRQFQIDFHDYKKGKK